MIRQRYLTRLKKSLHVLLSAILVFNSFTPLISSAHAQEATPSANTETLPTSVVSSVVEKSLSEPIPDLIITNSPDELSTTPVSVESATLSDSLDLGTSEEDISITEEPSEDTVIYQNLSIGTEYRYKDTPVVITFTSLTTPGSLTIREFEPENSSELGVIGKAYEIYSDMENGTFAYDLTLPLPEDNEDIHLEYADSPQDLYDNNTQDITNSSEVNGDTITYTGLDHFTVFIFTDDSADYSPGGLWFDYPTQGYYGDSHHFPTTTLAGETATWTFSTITPGTYEVFISWSTHSNRTTAAPYILNYDGGSTPPIIVNQERLADQLTIGGSGEWSGWFSLGSFPLDTASTIVLSSVDNTSGTDYVIADEIMITQAPQIISPANTAILTTANLPKIDWTDSTGTDGPFTYRYQAFSDDAYTINRWGPSSWLPVSEIPTSGTPEGVYYVRVQAQDDRGNITGWSNGAGNPFKITIDNTAPVLTFDTPSDGALESGTVSLKATCNETCDYVNFWWREDSEPYSSASKRYHYEHTNGTVFEWDLNTLSALKADGLSYPMVDGTYHLYAAAKDLAGNWTRTPDITITIDNTAPDVFLASPTTPTVSGIVPIRGAVTDTHPHHYWLVIQDSGGNTIAGPGVVNDSNSFTDQLFFDWNTTTLPNGDYTIKLEARDALGNKDSGSVAWFQVAVLNDTIVSGTKWNDSDGNGTQDIGELGLENWTILGTQEVDSFIIAPYDISTNSIPVSTSVSLDNGQDYIIRVSGSYLAGDSITADAMYSMRSPNTIWTDLVQNYESYGPTLLDLQINNSSVNWGTYNSSHVYWYPLTGTGNPLDFRLYDTYPNNNTGDLDVSIYKIVGSAITDINGDYELTLPSLIGDIVITEVTQTPWAQTAPSSDPFGYHTVVGGSTTSDLDFGNQMITSSVSGYKLNDLDGDLQTTDDQDPVLGWNIDLYECFSNLQTCGVPIATQTTDNDGYYSFSGILPGFYKLIEQLESGWANLSPLSIDLTVDANQDIEDNNFINALGSISGIKYQDRDGNGSYDSQVDYLEDDWTIFIDENNNQTLDGEEIFTTTDTNGYYEFPQLLGDQTYSICEVLETNWYQTAPGNYEDGPNCHAIELEPGQQVADQDFGNFHFARIYGSKFEDLDGDGFWDEGESGLEGWTINILGPDGYTDSRTTDEEGEYRFGDLPFAGQYIISEATQSGWIQTAPAEVEELGRVHVETEVESNSGRYNNDFGNYPYPVLEIAKDNDKKGQTLGVGDIVTYTIQTTNTGLGVAYGVQIEDSQPVQEYFDYLEDSGQLKLEPDGAFSPASATGTNPYYWLIGDILPGETYTLTYQIKIIDTSIPGEHDNIAVASGLSGDESEIFSNIVLDPFTVGSSSDFSGGVGSTSGEVLGASTTGEVLGAATGTPTYWSLLGILLILLGTLLRLPKDKLQKLIPSLALLIIPLAVATPAHAISDTINPVVSIVDLPQYKNTDTFEVSYTALDAGGSGLRDVTLEYHREGQGWQSLATLTTAAGKFQVTNTQITQDDRYYFKATACDNVNNCSTDETSTTIDRSAPPAPESFEKSWVNDYSYILKWHNANSDQSYKVIIYRYHEPNFIAQAGSQIAVVDVSPNTDTQWPDSHPDPKPYYYAIRSIDPAGNTSGLIGDPDTNVTTTTYTDSGTVVTGTESYSGTELSLSTVATGQVLGQQDSQTEEGDSQSPPSPDETVEVSTNQAITDTPDSSPENQFSFPWLLAIVALVLATLTYFTFFKKK